MRRRLARASLIPALVVLFVVGHAPTVSALVDLTGGWFIKYDFDVGGPDHWDIAQSGGNLTVTFPDSQTFTGTIDPSTGVFDIDFGPSSVPSCPDNSFHGTAAADSQTFNGTATYPSNPHGCTGLQVGITGSRCGNGVLDPGEQCDDGNESAGDCCSPTCTYESSASSCTSDGNPCTDDTCDGAGTCQHVDNTAACTLNDGCVSGTCAGGSCAAGSPLPAGTACDSDANVCTLEACDGSGACMSAGTVDCAPCGTCDATRGCVGYPAACTGATMASITLKTGALPSDKHAVWKWQGTTTLADFGDPTTTTDYTLCVYENETAQTPGVILRASAPAGGMCRTRACWAAKTDGFAYKDPDRTPDGLSPIKLKASPTAGKSVLGVKGKGGMLPLTATLPTGVPFVAQLHAVDGSSDTCWGSSFDTPSKSTATLFKAKTP